jgi:mRNA-degrading endonuclease RelE of RelBE toxin-antitoxin system
MAYELKVSEECKPEIKRLCSKNKPFQEALDKKILQILENPYHFKPLKYPMHGRRRVHVFKSFVLSFEILEAEKRVNLLSLDHHDDAY